MTAAYGYVIVVSLVLGLCAGVLMHRADFCLVCTVRNFFLFRDSFMIRVTGLLVVAGMGLFETLRLFGLLRLDPVAFFGPPSLANLLGGVVFGLGMVLAGGCVAGTLFRLGSGSLPSLLAFAGLLVGSLLYAEFHPWWRGVAGATILAPDRVTAAQLLGVPSGVLVWPVLLGAAFLLAAQARSGRLSRRAAADGYLQPWKAAVALAAIGGVSVLLVGMPLGITSGIAKMGGYLEGLAFPGHMAGLAFFREEPLSYLHPFTGERLTGGAGPRLDAVAAIQFPLICGIVAGGAVSAIVLREFRRFRPPPLRQGVAALAGGILMGLGSRMAAGCNVWHIIAGLPLLALQSLLFVLGLVPGAGLGSRLLVRFVIRP
jgi:uncharacterized membrane protein YedE/YeeE